MPGTVPPIPFQPRPREHELSTDRMVLQGVVTNWKYGAPNGECGMRGESAVLLSHFDFLKLADEGRTRDAQSGRRAGSVAVAEIEYPANVGGFGLGQ